MLIELLQTPGVHALSLDGPVGALEVVLTVPEGFDSSKLALIGHPHPLQGGTMNNKVVTTLVKLCSDLSIASIRFNFRGVGGSFGEFAHGIGESEDMLFLARLAASPNQRVLFMGFSFGSYVAYRCLALFQADPNFVDLPSKKPILVSIAPPVTHYDYKEFAVNSPWIMVQGNEDEVVPAAKVYDLSRQIPHIIFLPFEQTSHFFHGKLLQLKAELLSVLSPMLSSS